MKTTVAVQEVTTKKIARKLGANCCSSGGGSFRLQPALLLVVVFFSFCVNAIIQTL